MNWLIAASTAATTGAAPAPAASGGMGGIIQMVVLIGGMFLIFYFLMIRPQKKQEKARLEMLKALKKGDKVVTIGGIHGVVMAVSDEEVTLKVDNNVSIRFARSAVNRVATGTEGEGK